MSFENKGSVNNSEPIVGRRDIEKNKTPIYLT